MCVLISRILALKTITRNPTQTTRRAAYMHIRYATPIGQQARTEGRSGLYVSFRCRAREGVPSSAVLNKNSRQNVAVYLSGCACTGCVDVMCALRVF